MADAQLQWRRHDRPGVNTVVLGRAGRRLIGRGTEASVKIEGDKLVSRAHAELSYLEGAWLIEDVGSSGGTFIVRGATRTRLVGKRRLRHDDRIAVGSTILQFRWPPGINDAAVTTIRAGTNQIVLTPGERTMLKELCVDELSGRGGTPSNKALADRLFIAPDTVRTVLKSLYRKFDLGHETHAQRRGRLVRRAIDEGWVDDGG